MISTVLSTAEPRTMNKAPVIPSVINSSITEWDMKSANVSVLEYYDLLPKNQIDAIRKLSSEKRKVAVGLLEQKRPELAEKLERGFDSIVKMFIEVNNLDEDIDVLSIKKDAVFVIAKTPAVTEFGPVKFVAKNTYHSFIQVGAFEFYIGKDDVVDVKGLQKMAELHKKGILFLISDVVKTAGLYSIDKTKMSTYLSDLVRLYKNKELDFEYYREFNSQSKFSVFIDGERYLYDEISEEDIDDVDISYNYINIILPLVRLFL